MLAPDSQSCSAQLSLGHVAADASCSHGFLCCDTTCATAAKHPEYVVRKQLADPAFPGLNSAPIVLHAPAHAHLHGLKASSITGHSCPAPPQGLCVPPCAEDVIGITFYRLMFTDMATASVVNFAEAIVKRLLLRMAMPVDPPAVRSSTSCLPSWLCPGGT